MTTTQLTTIAGLVVAVTGACQAVPGIDAIPGSRVVLGLLSAIAIAVLGYYAKGRADTGKV